MRRMTKLSWKMRLLLIGSFFLLGLVRLAILTLPFNYLKPLIGKQMAESSHALDPKLLAKALKVGWAVNEASTYTPWESKCLVRALTSHIILRALHVPCTLYLGLKKGDSKQLQAHAWLRCGSLTLVGAREREGFKSIVHFSTLVR